MIYGITGRRGVGKTLLMTWFIMEFVRKYKAQILTNYTLYGIPYKYMKEPPLKAQDFLDSIKDKLCGFDELQNWANCRKSMSKDNQHINAVASLSRHSKSHIFYTTQSIMKIDKILRFETDYIITIKNALKLKNEKYPKGIPLIITYQIENVETGKKVRRTIDVRKTLKHYDTYEMMPLPDSHEDRKREQENNRVVLPEDEIFETMEADVPIVEMEAEAPVVEAGDAVFEAKLKRAKRAGQLRKGV